MNSETFNQPASRLMSQAFRYATIALGLTIMFCAAQLFDADGGTMSFWLMASVGTAAAVLATNGMFSFIVTSTPSLKDRVLNVLPIVAGYSLIGTYLWFNPDINFFWAMWCLSVIAIMVLLDKAIR